MSEFYKYQCTLNASHSFDGNREHEHNHTFLLVLSVKNLGESPLSFDRLEEAVLGVLTHYEETYLNDWQEFAEDASIEALGNVFFEKLCEAVRPLPAELLQLEIGDSPLSLYQVKKMDSET